MAKDSSVWVAEHATWLSGLLRGLTRSEAEAEDAFQDVWLRVFKSGGLDRVSAPRAYLARIARSVVIDRHRRDGRYELVLDVEDEMGQTRGEGLVDESPQPSVRVERAVTHDDVLAAIRALPVGPRQVALLRIEGELTFQEISDELKVSLGTTLTWMRSATAQLKRSLGR